jgi:hypothetical protein
MYAAKPDSAISKEPVEAAKLAVSKFLSLIFAKSMARSAG